MDLLWSNPNAALRSQGTVKWARAAERSFSSEACHLGDELVGGQSWILHVPGGSSGWLLNFTAKRGVCPNARRSTRTSGPPRESCTPLDACDECIST